MKKIPRRKCKCQYCGKFGYTTDFYRVEGKNRNLYYCNEDEYIEMMVENSNRIELLKLITDEIWFKQNYKMTPRILQKELKDLAEIYNYEVVLNTVRNNKDTLRYWMNQEKKFNSEFAQSRYFIAIVKGEINNEWEKWNIENKREELESEDVEDVVDLDILNNLDRGITRTENRGIMDFLEEDDY